MQTDCFPGDLQIYETYSFTTERLVGITEDRFLHRVRKVNEVAVRSDSSYALYWMIAARRTTFNFGLDRAIDWARKLGKPLVVFEPLRVAYPWASDRLHRFVIDGMRDKASLFSRIPVFYYPYVESYQDADKGLLAALASKACVVVTDDYPCFFLPRMIAAAALKIRVAMEAVDSNGILPMRAADRAFTAAYHYRRYMQKNLPLYADKLPLANPLASLDLPAPIGLLEKIQKQWPAASEDLLAGDPRALQNCRLIIRFPSLRCEAEKLRQRKRLRSS